MSVTVSPATNRPYGVQRHAKVRRLRDFLVSIPDIATTTAAVHLAAVVDMPPYESARQVAAYPGPVSRLRHSGPSTYSAGHLSGVRPSRVRHALHFPALAT